jgi:hypothetical protein
MIKYSISLIALAMLVATGSGAIAQQNPPQFPNPNPEDLKHGAVLCAWGIYLAAKDIGETCYPSRDTAFQATLEKEIARIDRFILDNAPMTKEQLEQLKQTPPFKPQTALLCQQDLRHLYEVLRKAGPQKLDSSITDLLSVPRKPVLNPCL